MPHTNTIAPAAMRLDIPKSLLNALNQLCEIEHKVIKLGSPAGIERNIAKMKDAFAELGLVYENPMGQAFQETRSDLDATITGNGTDSLVVVEVIKPIVRLVVRDGSGEFSKIVQKGVVLVESRKEG